MLHKVYRICASICVYNSYLQGRQKQFESSVAKFVWKFLSTSA